MRNAIDRRSFGRLCTALAVAVLAAPTALTWAEDLPHVDENAPQAKALGYRHDAALVDKAKFKNFIEGSDCANCALYQGGEEWGPCMLFAGQSVSAKGWCSAWSKKPA